MTLPSELPPAERISRAQALLEEAAVLLGEYRELEGAAQAKLMAAQRKYAEAQAMMPLPLFDRLDNDKGE